MCMCVFVCFHVLKFICEYKSPVGIACVGNDPGCQPSLSTLFEIRVSLPLSNQLALEL